MLETATLGGLVCPGKTHRSELAFSGLGLNPVTAPQPCLNDDKAVPGGGCSGAAASVAFGLAPAAWNDLVGLKTTAASLPLTGILPLCETFDTVGPLAHSVEDCSLLLVALHGKRLAVRETVALDDLRDRSAKGVDDAVARLVRSGAPIARLKVPELTEAYGIWRALIEKVPEKMVSRILDRFRSGANFAAEDDVVVWRRLHEIRAIWADRTAGFYAVILPTAPILPPDAQRLMTDDAYYVAENLLALRNTRIGHMLGLCVLIRPSSQPS